MNKIYILFLLFTSIVGVIHASNTQVNGIWYDFDNSTQTASVTYRGSNSSSYSNEYSSSIDIPSSVTYGGKSYRVTSIGSSAFYKCTSLTSVTIPNSVTSIGDDAFYNCSGLTSVTIGNSVTSIGGYAFHSCSGLTSVTLGNSVTSIESCAFCNCSSLTSVTIPNSVISIGNGAFLGCSSLTSVTIPNSVTSIGNCAFTDCSGLTYIVVEGGNTTYDSRDNSNAIIKTETNTLLVGCKNTIVPNSVTSIGREAFYGCTGLTSITIPNSVTSIGYCAFLGCAALTNITIPDSVTSIGILAFCDCSSLTSVTIGNSVTSIGKLAFCNCKLTSVVICCTTPPSLGDESFNFAPGTIYVPCGTLTAYKNAWGEYADRITYKPFPYQINVISNITAGNIIMPQNLQYICDNPIVSIEANPNYGYHFIQWSDGVIDNPRIVEITQDTTIEAIFAKNTYSITKVDSEYGNIQGITQAEYLDEVSLDAIPNYGYHFTKWSDGNTDNPRSFVLTQDTTFAAEFAKNSYSITTSCNDTTRGSTYGAGSYLYLDTIIITATPQYGYHFVKWSDDSIASTRSIILTQDTTFDAIFAKNTYSYTAAYDETLGTIEPAHGEYEYLSEVTISATPNYGYHFAKWRFPQIPQRQDVITPSQAYSIAAALSSGATSSQQYTIVGYITGKYGTYVNSYYLSDSPDVTGKFIAFKCQTSANIGDYVLVTGYLTNYKGTTPETTSGSTISLVPNVTVVEDNPYMFIIERDTIITVEFAKNVYNISKHANTTQGSISGVSQAKYLDTVELTAVPNYGYHFTQWSDGDKNNPRSFVITRDTTFTAEFAKNEYVITTSSSNPEWGATTGDGSALYQEQLQISATSNYGYHFAHWNDGNTSNPRTITVTENKTYTAIFAKNIYTITKQTNSEQGSVSGVSQAEYLDNVKLTAVSNYGYHFTQWSDGVKDNPRSFVITRDTTFTAEFAYDRTGKCGDNLALTWTYNPEKKVLMVDGNGAFVENIQCGVEARPIMEKVIIGKGVTAMNSTAFVECPKLTAVEWNATNGGNCTACPFPTSVTSISWGNDIEHIPAYICKGLTGINSIIIPSSVKSIGDYAFANINSRKINNLVLPSEIISIGNYAFAGNTYIEQIDFGKSLESIGAHAFQGCSRVMTMTCLAEVTPDVGTGGLTSISSSADLYVLSSALKKYQVDPNWSRFLLKELGATGTTTTDKNVTVTADENTATFTWPTNNNASTYSIVITKDGVTICTLVFNANGQLTGIAFAPSKNGSRQAPSAIMENSAAQFTVTGLNSASKYGYRLAVTDESNEEIVAYSGEFATTGYVGEVNPGGEPEYNPEDIDQTIQEPTVNSQKLLINGQIFILRGDKTYTITGAEVK